MKVRLIPLYAVKRFVILELCVNKLFAGNTESAPRSAKYFQLSKLRFIIGKSMPFASFLGTSTPERWVGSAKCFFIGLKIRGPVFIPLILGLSPPIPVFGVGATQQWQVSCDRQAQRRVEARG